MAQLTEVPREKWVIFLTPLLDEVSAACRNGMPTESCSDYDVVKTALLTLHDFHRGYYRSRREIQHWVEAEGISYHNLLNDMASTQGAWKKLEDNMQDWMLREQFLRVLHPEVSSYVKLQDPKTAREAATIASRYHTHNPHLPYLRPKAESSGSQWTRRRDDRGSSRGLGGCPREGPPSYKNRDENRQGRADGSRKDQPPKESWGKSEPMKCWTCGAEGHIQKHCPNKRECNAIHKDTSPPKLFPGTIFGHPVQSIFINSGANQSMVHPKWMPADIPVQGKMFIEGPFADRTLKTRRAAIRLCGRSVHPMVTSDPRMKYDAIIGREVVGAMALLEG